MGTSRAFLHRDDLKMEDRVASGDCTEEREYHIIEHFCCE
ncbi:hypothetical protein SNOG_02937 [Parastagonospora nodorum SN15]|uniref:Uncharacterized protein n=1 Tax=Phaeosphaeria nodorum (strain SN15 / ATCC MYA-4574 / FGSC 10173) TaxID=321614 RepID=Q0UZ77_PHANO|nr:hypothetical protein SNOG_02937 [Parastagonospora nodorum SN15]EAT89668.1 hypothetical protein SNOG_02937 [Parastagonospora nodorum SN15]